MQKKIHRLLLEFLMILLVLAWISPFIYPIMISLKPTSEVYRDTLSWPTTYAFENYKDAWIRSDMGLSLVSTGLFTFLSLAVLIVIGSMCAYTLARRDGKIWGAVYSLFVVGIILPYKLGLLPTYVVFNRLGLTGSILGITLIFIGVQIPMAVFLYTGFIRALPVAYEEAAQLEGASASQTFWLVIFPQLMPITATVAIQTGMAIWNEFFISLIFLGGSKWRPLSVALYSYVGDNATQWNLVFATVIISLVPAALLFVFAQKNMIRGFSGGLKG